MPAPKPAKCAPRRPAALPLQVSDNTAGRPINPVRAAREISFLFARDLLQMIEARRGEPS